MCGGDALDLFEPLELELLICGNPVLNFADLQKGATYEVSVYALINAHIYSPVCVFIHACINTHIHAHAYVFVCMFVRVCVAKCMYAYNH